MSHRPRAAGVTPRAAGVRTFCDHELGLMSEGRPGLARGSHTGRGWRWCANWRG